MPKQFPEHFTWGVATSAFQIEGGRYEDGKGESIWDRFSDAGRIPDPGDITCDHYHRWEEDVALMADLGVTAYRFSVAWTRVLPDGDGDVNHAGLDFYRRLVNGLRDHGIVPWLTLYHWDLPQTLQDRGGWLNRGTADAFARYASVTSAALGDSVINWITHNEPWVAAFVGHRDGVFAPGLESFDAALTAAHHLLLSHGLAVPEIRANAPGSEVGIAIDCRPSRPAGDDPQDATARRHFDGFRNRWFFDPVFGRGYPTDMLSAYDARGHLPSDWADIVLEGDLDTVAAPIDFLGLNYYTSLSIAAGDDESEDTGVPAGPNPPVGYTEMGWPITPGALTGYLLHITERYAPQKILITENGASYRDGPGVDSHIRDGRRINYLRQHVAAAHDAIAAGVPLDGYFVWSLLDNLEWAHGFSQRFGLVWVDHATGERIPKDSFRWYRDVVAANGLE